MAEKSSPRRLARSQIARGFNQFSRRINWGWLVIALVFAINLILISPKLMPTLHDLNPGDETKYIDSGRSLVRGYTRGFEWSPLSSFFYAPIYLVVREWANWFSWMATFGRILLFTMMWFSFYHLGRQFESYFSRWIVPGAMLVSFSLLEILKNPSDALFASMSCLAMARLVAYRNQRRIRDIWLGSAFMGLAALSRNDGLFLYPAFFGLAVYLGRKRETAGRVLAATIIPASVLVVGYLARSGLTAGDWDLGTGGRGYTAYTWSLSTNFGYEAQEITDRLGEDIDASQSFIRAIVRRPDLLLMQVRHNLARLPSEVLEAYGKRIAPPLFYLAVLGAFFLWRRRETFLLALLLFWPLHSLIYLGFYLRPGFLLLDQFTVLILAALGAEFMRRQANTTTDRVLWSAPFALLALYGGLFSKLAFLVAGLIPFLALWTWWAASRSSEPRSASAAYGMMALLIAGLLLRNGYPFPNYPRIGETPMDRAVQFLEQVLPEGARIYSYEALPPLAAKMTHLEWNDLESEFHEQIGFCDLLREQRVRALFVTPDTILKQPELWDNIEIARGSCLERSFVVDPGSIQIFIVEG